MASQPEPPDRPERMAFERTGGSGTRLQVGIALVLGFVLAAILKPNSALNRVIAQGQLQAFLELELDAEIGAEKSGCAVEAKVQRTVDMYRQALDIAQAVPAAQVFTNEFMEWCR